MVVMIKFTVGEMAVSGYPELYDITNNNYHNFNNKEQAWRQISAAPEISGKFFSSTVA